jgi:cardiolipin synthase A/B
VERGVQCRVLLDAFGSKHALRMLRHSMQKLGIEVVELLPVGPFRKNAARFDLRNHRKIAVIDGKVGYTGSQNIVNPSFVRGYPNEELFARIEGPLVAQLQAVFLADHYFETDKLLHEADLFPKPELVGDTIGQMVPSGPGYGRENGRDLIVSLLYRARRVITITTPYFVPDEPFLQAIRAATSHGGVQVRLILSQHANQLITQLAQRSFYDDLLDAGVELYLYRPRFLHAKHITIDDDIALIGSTNMDIRSFALNSEVNLLVYDCKVVRELTAIQQHYFDQSNRLSLEEWRKRSLGARVAQNTARLMDSFL